MSEESESENQLIGRVVLGRYRIVRPLARGGMGLIYLARSEGAADFVKPVVVKRMLSDHADASAVKMFKREARIMSMLRHPGIVSVTDFGREDGSYLLVMDYVHGFHLGRWASFVQQARGQGDGAQGQLPWQMAVHVCIQVLDALEYAHTLKGPDGNALHIVHRDVSPSNVLLDIEGRVLLADFGIAKTALGEEETKTTVGTVKGKFSYMAPEILEGAAPMPTADVYATAVVLHEVLVGRNEFRTQEPAATIQRVLHHSPRRLDVVRPDVPSALADVVARALLKRPEERFQSAAELAKALRRVRGLDAEEANAELRQTLERDFRDPRFAQMFDLPELDTLEHSWRTMPDGVLDPASFPPAEPSRQSIPTRPQRLAALEPAVNVELEAPLPPPPALPTVATPTRGGSAGWIVAAILGLIGLGVGVGLAVWISQTPTTTPDVVFVEATPSGIVATDAAVVLPDAFVELPDAFVPPETTTRDPDRSHPRAAVDPGEIINRTFARHTSAVRACFEGTTPPSGQVYLRFTTNAAGGVDSVDVTPADVGAGAVGRCIAGVARRIDFGREVGARSFRIPITVRAE